MSREILDCLKRKPDICIKSLIPSWNTVFMLTPTLRILQDWKLDRSLSNLFHRSLPHKSIMGTLIFPDSAFQWAWLSNGLNMKSQNKVIVYLLTFDLSHLCATIYFLGKPAVGGSECTEEWSYIKRLKNEVKTNHQELVSVVWPK